MAVYEVRQSHVEWLGSGLDHALYFSDEDGFVRGHLHHGGGMRLVASHDDYEQCDGDAEKIAAVATARSLPDDDWSDPDEI